MDEYCSAYGAAAPEVKEYYAYFRKNIWENRLLPNKNYIVEKGRFGNFRRGLMWNLEQYYKDVAPQLKELYDMIRNRYSYYQTLVNPSSGGTTGSIDNTELYPLTFVRQMDKVIKEAFDVIEKYPLDGLVKKEFYKI